MEGGGGVGRSGKEAEGSLQANNSTVRTNTCPERTTSTTARSGPADTAAGSNT